MNFDFNNIGIITLILITTSIVVCSIFIVISIQIQKKQKNKYKRCMDAIREAGNDRFDIKTNLSEEDIKKIDSSIDLNELLKKLYNIYITFQNKVCQNELTGYDNLLTKTYIDIILNRINKFISKGAIEKFDDINILEYAITRYSNEKCEMRLRLNCFYYILENDKIIKGSNIKRREFFYILKFKKESGNWLLDYIEVIFDAGY